VDRDGNVGCVCACVSFGMRDIKKYQTISLTATVICYPLKKNLEQDRNVYEYYILCKINDIIIRIYTITCVSFYLSM